MLKKIKQASLWRHRRMRLLLWATLTCCLFGVLKIAEPIEHYLHTLRNSVSSHPASGTIAVVGIDDRSMAEVDKWPWPRRNYALLLDRLREEGARRIFFDIHFFSRSNPADDSAFETALSKAPGQVYLAARFTIDPITHRRMDQMPRPEFSRHAQIGSINVWAGLFGEIWTMPYALNYGDKPYESFSSLLANISGPVGEQFPIDQRIDLKSIPTFSAVDVMRGQLHPYSLMGKDVIVGLKSELTGDTHFAAGKGIIPGVFFHVLGAETLKQGRPIEWGWFPAALLAFVVAYGYLRSTRHLQGLVALAVTTTLLLILPYFLESRLIFVDIVPALLLLGFVAVRNEWHWHRRLAATTNIVSGLPSLAALREQATAPREALIVAHIHNYSQITGALPPETEKEIVNQITARLTLGAHGAQIYQGDDGSFAWSHQGDPMTITDDQLAGLHALFANSLVIGGQSLDLNITFGIDTDSSQPLSNRVGRAQVAANEAAATGLRWKYYDPSRQADDDWKLSMLGSLDAALDSGEVWVAYQPKLDLASNQIIGVEALARWTHPTRGDISPVEFVAFAEHFNRIEKLTLFVLNRAVRDIMALGYERHGFGVAVNLSARLLDRADYPGIVAAILHKHGMAPERLTLEITESVAIGDKDQAMATLAALRALGIGISIDDYGTGLSTMDYMKTIPATEIKIDKSFVLAIPDSAGDRIMVGSTIDLAHQLGRKVVAEGVESAEVLAMLQSMGCDYAQGFHIARPMRLAALAILLRREMSEQAA